MILHYLKIAWRNLLKYKTQSVISVLGLTIGIVFFTYGYHWYRYETTYDSFYPDSDRIYHLQDTLKSTGKQIESGQLPYIKADKITQAFPEIEAVAILHLTVLVRIHRGYIKALVVRRARIVRHQVFLMKL